MKRNILYPFIILFSLFGCSYLDYDDRGELTEDMVFEGHSSKRNFLYSIYQSLPRVDNYIDGAMLAAATDDAEFVDEFSSIQRFNSANITVSYNPENQWSHFYTGIRRCNTFLEN